MLEKIYYKKTEPHKVEDERLQRLIMDDPFVNAIYQRYRKGLIDYEEMLIQMVCKLAETKQALTQSYIKDLEKHGVPCDVKEL